MQNIGCLWTVDREPWTLDRGPQVQKRQADHAVLLPSHCLLATGDRQLTTAQPQPRTLVDIRLKNAQKVSLSLTFQPARRDLPVAKLDPQTISCQADRT